MALSRAIWGYEGTKAVKFFDIGSSTFYIGKLLWKELYGAEYLDILEKVKVL